MSGKCMFHSGHETMIKNAQKDATEAREDVKKILEAIHKKASTATLITIFALIVSALGIVTKLAYDSYQMRIARLENQDTIIQIRMDNQIEQINIKLDTSFKNINNRLDSIQSVAKRLELGKAKKNGEGTYP